MISIRCDKSSLSCFLFQLNSLGGIGIILHVTLIALDLNTPSSTKKGILNPKRYDFFSRPAACYLGSSPTGRASLYLGVLMGSEEFTFALNAGGKNAMDQQKDFWSLHAGETGDKLSTSLMDCLVRFADFYLFIFYLLSGPAVKIKSQRTVYPRIGLIQYPFPRFHTCHVHGLMV